ncbi:MAG: TonB-dependent receptor [Gammaproteobacteria bacterium]|jgi:iron complex outermembrane receptor protein
MKRKLLRTAVAAALAGSVGATSQLVWAQEGGLEEIVVTATRRAQDLQEVPVSIVAITGDNLVMQGLDSLEDVGNNIPNLNIQGGGAGTYGTQFRIRGLPNVGVYVDGVWQVGTNGFLVQDFVDVDRIEVLRGPQGTTYGRDAVGGAIRIWTRQPGEEFGGQVTATTGSYGRRDIRASVDVPITDNLLTKWTASSLYRDGFIEGLTVAQDFGELDQEVYRGDILWTPTDSLSMRVTYSDDDLIMNEPRIQDGIFDTANTDHQNWGVIPAQFYGLAVEGALLRPASEGGPVDLGIDAFTPENFQAGYPGGKVGKWQNRSNASLPSHISNSQATVDINWDLTDNMSVQFLSAFTTQDTDINVDWENSDYTLVEDITRGRLDVFSEEIQLTGGGDRIQWVAGLYYWDQESLNRDARFVIDEFRTLQGNEGPQLLLSDVYRSERCTLLRDPATNPEGLSTCEDIAGLALNAFAYDRLNRNETDGWAAFGELTFGLTDRLDLTVGMRHHDQSNTATPMALIPGVSAPRPRTGNMLHTGGDPFAGADGTPNKVQFDQNTYKAALQMQFNDDIMGYLSYSEGFDSGGVSSITTGSGSNTTQLFFPYDPQIIKNKEIGMRSDLADGRIRFNATVFFSDWNNIQNSGVVRDENGNELPQLVTTNVGTAEANGVELEMTFLPTDNLQFNVNVGLLDTEYTDIADGTFSLDETTEFAQAPDTTYNIGIQHTANLSNGGTWTSRLDYAYTDQFWRSLPFLRMDWYGEQYGGPVPDNYDESGDWGVVNARFTYEAPGGDYAVSIFGTNLTDEYMLNSGFFHGIWGYNFATVSRPREVGASLRFNF